MIWLLFAFVLDVVTAHSVESLAGDKKKDDPKKNEPIFSQTDSLTAKDEKDTHPLTMRSPRKVYSIKLTEAKVYQFDLKSKAFDAVLRLENSAGKQVAFNDDANEKTLDSRMIYKATATAEYKIISTCLDNNPGRFDLTVIEAVGLTTASPFKSKPIDLKLKAGEAHLSGVLIEKDALYFNHYYKVYTVALEMGKRYRFEMSSADFETHLVLEDPYGNKLAASGSVKKRPFSVFYTAEKDGDYRLIASSAASRRTGRFALEIALEK